MMSAGRPRPLPVVWMTFGAREAGAGEGYSSKIALSKLVRNSQRSSPTSTMSSTRR